MLEQVAEAVRHGRTTREGVLILGRLELDQLVEPLTRSKRASSVSCEAPAGSPQLVLPPETGGECQVLIETMRSIGVAL